MAGMILRPSIKHIGTGIHFAWGSDLICIGTLRDAEPSRFYDVITIMERDDTEPVQRAQGDALAKACAASTPTDMQTTFRPALRQKRLRVATTEADRIISAARRYHRYPA
jgi:hypothetical protein